MQLYSNQISCGCSSCRHKLCASFHCDHGMRFTKLTQFKKCLAMTLCMSLDTLSRQTEGRMHKNNKWLPHNQKATFDKPLIPIANNAKMQRYLFLVVLRKRSKSSANGRKILRWCPTAFTSIQPGLSNLHFDPTCMVK